MGTTTWILGEKPDVDAMLQLTAGSLVLLS